MVHKLKSPMRLSAAVPIILLTACASLPERLQTHSMPIFATDRVEHIGEPFTIVMVSPRKMDTLSVRDQMLQAMPVVLERKHLSDGSRAKWSDLARKVYAPLVDDPETAKDRDMYVLGRARTLPTDSTHLQVEQIAKISELGFSAGVDPRPDLERREREFLQKLDDDSIRTTDLLLVCVSATRKASKCFEPGGRYQLTLQPDRGPPADFPFRIERRNGTLGAITGFLLIGLFVFLNTT